MTRGRALPALAVAVALAGARAAGAAPLPERAYGLPRDASADGFRVDQLIHFTTVASSIIFVAVCAVLLWALIRHGRRHRASYDHGSRASIGVIVGTVAVIAVVVDGYLFVHSLFDMEGIFWNFAAAEERDDVVRVEVQAHQWAWAARYAGQDGRFNTEDDVVTLNDVRVPVGATVLVQLASVDVIHSFNLPNFRVKRDAVPGEITRLVFRTREPGEFVISCAQHCGANHYKMRGVLTVLTPDRYREWLATEGAFARARFDPDDAEARWGWEWRTE